MTHAVAGHKVFIPESVCEGFLLKISCGIRLLIGRRCGVVVLPTAFGPDADSLPRFDPPLIQGASRDVVHRLRLNTMQRPGHTCRKALAPKKKRAGRCGSALFHTFPFKIARFILLYPIHLSSIFKLSPASSQASYHV